MVKSIQHGKNETAVVTEAMKSAGADVVVHSDYGNPIMFETTDDIAENIIYRDV